jgi:hypothetical protein
MRPCYARRLAIRQPLAAAVASPVLAAALAKLVLSHPFAGIDEAALPP